MKGDSKHALVVPLYGELQAACLDRVKGWMQHGFLVVVVNNNQEGLSLEGVNASIVVHNHNHLGLAGGFNAGVDVAVANGAEYITLLDQDSAISCTSLERLAKACTASLVVGPRIIDVSRNSEHTSTVNKPRMLISSGTTFKSGIWAKAGPFKGWMEIDYIDHEWCSRAQSVGIGLKVISQAKLLQTFGTRHPNRIAHHLGMQLYSPYRRAISIRNLRWLLFQSYVPVDIRLKELIKMILKPWLWLVLEPERHRWLNVVRLGLTTPLNKPFPKDQLRH